MSDDWIKMRCNLNQDTAILGIAAAVKLDRRYVVGCIHAVWSWADSQTADGWLPHVTPAFIDEIAGRKGIAAAMANVKPQPWLIVKTDGLLLPSYEKHNGASAKNRAQAATRQRDKRTRENVTPVTPTSRPERDNHHALTVTKPAKPSRPKRDATVTRERVRERSITTTTTTTKLKNGSEVLTEAHLPALAKDFPDIDLLTEYRAAKRKLCREAGTFDHAFTTHWFVNHWLPHSPRRAPDAHALPPDFAPWLDKTYPDLPPETRREYLEKYTLKTLPTTLREAYGASEPRAADSASKGDSARVGL